MTKIACQLGLPRAVVYGDGCPAFSVIPASGAAMTVSGMAIAVDKLHDGDKSDLDQELFAQGVGNALAGVIGALPVTGVIVRSTANVSTGATTRWSAILHGLWLLIAVAAVPFLLELSAADNGDPLTAP